MSCNFFFLFFFFSFSYMAVPTPPELPEPTKPTGVSAKSNKRQKEPPLPSPHGPSEQVLPSTRNRNQLNPKTMRFKKKTNPNQAEHGHVQSFACAAGAPAGRNEEPESESCRFFVRLDCSRTWWKDDRLSEPLLLTVELQERRTPSKAAGGTDLVLPSPEVRIVDPEDTIETGENLDAEQQLHLIFSKVELIYSLHCNSNGGHIHEVPRRNFRNLSTSCYINMQTSLTRPT